MARSDEGRRRSWLRLRLGLRLGPGWGTSYCIRRHRAQANASERVTVSYEWDVERFARWSGMRQASVGMSGADDRPFDWCMSLFEWQAWPRPRRARARLRLRPPRPVISKPRSRLHPITPSPSLHRLDALWRNPMLTSEPRNGSAQSGARMGETKATSPPPPGLGSGSVPGLTTPSPDHAPAASGAGLSGRSHASTSPRHPTYSPDKSPRPRPPPHPPPTPLELRPLAISAAVMQASRRGPFRRANESS